MEGTPKNDFENGIFIHEGDEYHFPVLPPEVLAILEDGGLIPHVEKEVGNFISRLDPTIRSPLLKEALRV